MAEFTMKIETENETLFRKVVADNSRQAVETTAKNLFWILGEESVIFSISVEKIDGMPLLITFEDSDNPFDVSSDRNRHYKPN